MNKAVDFLVRELSSITDPYALAVVTYALHLAESSSRDLSFDKLQAAANTSGEFKSWAKPRTDKDRMNPWASVTSSVDVEMTAYALLTYLQRGLVTEALPIMRWMVTQRNSNGGFASTQVLFEGKCFSWNVWNSTGFWLSGHCHRSVCSSQAV